MKNFGNIMWGLVLILLGVIIGTNVLGLTDINIFFDGWWTLFIIIPCLIGLVKEREKTGSIIGILIGIILLLCCQNILDFETMWKLIIPAVLIIVGASFVFKNIYDSKLNKEIKNDTTLIEISKTDITGEKELEGATLTILDKDNNIIDKWRSTKKSHKIEGLTVGKTYILREEIAPNGYVIATDIKFTVKNTTDAQKITMKDKIVEVTKTDITTEEKLEGATLEVIDKEGNVVDKWTSTKEPHKVIGLKENETYTLKEITAPYGYEIAEEITFTVSDNKENQKIEMKDDYIKTNITLRKIDSETKNIIKRNFKFGLYSDENCTNLIKEYESKNNGIVTFDNLIYGTYYIKEIIAPNGYVKKDDIVKIEINDKGIFINETKIEDENGYYFNFENTKVNTPKTGDTRRTALCGILFIVSLIAFVFMKVKKRK